MSIVPNLPPLLSTTFEKSGSAIVKLCFHRPEQDKGAIQLLFSFLSSFFSSFKIVLATTHKDTHENIVKNLTAVCICLEFENWDSLVDFLDTMDGVQKGAGLLGASDKIGCGEYNGLNVSVSQTLCLKGLSFTRRKYSLSSAISPSCHSWGNSG